MTKELQLLLDEDFNRLVLEPGLFYSWKNSIRFEIAPPYPKDEKQKLKQTQERAISLFSKAFNEEDQILLVTDVYSTRKDNFLERKPLNVYLKYVKRKTHLYKLQYQLLQRDIDEEYERNESVIHRFVLPCKKSEIKYSSLLKAISYKGYSHPSAILKNNTWNGYEIYFINLSKKLIYHLYDDRGCDILASDKEDIRFLYEECNEWLLDYDRIQIDCLFEQGLFNSYETLNEKSKRIELNEIKVKETGINLTLDNTCIITHELEIPNTFAKECLKEMTNTSFNINFEQKGNSSLTVKATKKEALALIDYQAELMTLYSKKYKGRYIGWSVSN